MEEKNIETKLKQLPNSFEAEQSLLGAMLIDGVLAVAMAKEPEEMFYNAKHRTIFHAMKELVAKDSNVDIVTVFDLLERSEKSDDNMLPYLTELSQVVPSAANAEEYHGILIRDFTLRSLIQSCNKVIEEAYRAEDAEKVVQRAEQLIFGVSRSYQRGDLKHISSATSDLLKNIEKMMKSKGKDRGLRTRMPRLDTLLEGGLHKSDLIIIAARPSVGKTTIALNFLVNIVREEKDRLVAMFSLEMSSVQLAQRLLSNTGSVAMSDINRANFNDTGMEQLWAASKEYDASEIYFDETSMTNVEEIISKCRRLSTERKKPLDLVVIDYIQLMEGDKNNRSQQESRNLAISNISRKLKILAKEMNCPVIAISQMSRSIEGRDDKEPKLSDLRESGSIEQDADIVAFLYREDETVGKNESPVILDIAKHRNGRLGKIRMNFEGQFNRFIESGDQDNIQIKSKAKPKAGMQ